MSMKSMSLLLFNYHLIVYDLYESLATWYKFVKGSETSLIFVCTRTFALTSFFQTSGLIAFNLCTMYVVRCGMALEFM